MTTPYINIRHLTKKFAQHSVLNQLNLTINAGEIIAILGEYDALPGITRAAVIDIAKELSIPLAERDLSRHDIYTCDECFLTGTAAEVIAATKLDQRVLGTGKPGPITQKIIARFREIVGTTGTPV